MVLVTDSGTDQTEAVDRLKETWYESLPCKPKSIAQRWREYHMEKEHRIQTVGHAIRMEQWCQQLEAAAAAAAMGRIEVAHSWFKAFQ